MEELFEWPQWLRIPRKSDYSYEPVDRAVSTEMDIGTVKRVEFTTDETIVNCALLLNPLELRFFETFERDLLRQGCTWFTMPLLLGGRVEKYKARFKGRPKIGNLQGLYATVSFVLEIEKRSLLDPGMARLLLLLAEPEAFPAISDDLHCLLHREMPGLTTI